MSYLILMPFTFTPYRDKCIDTMDEKLKSNLLMIDNTELNTGAAASYNIGAKNVVLKSLDWLITLSPSTRFGPEKGLDFINFIENNKDAWVIESQMPVGWHFIAWNRKIFESIGYWDENFYPVYGEDADISRRILRYFEIKKIKNAWKIFDCDAWITMQGYSAHIGKKQESQDRIWDYYRAKWGGLSGHESFDFPFVDKPLSYWKPNSIS